MEKLLLALVVIHAVIIVFGVIGSTTSGHNFGLSYPLIKSDDVIEAPAQWHSKNKSYTYTSEERSIVNDHEKKLSARADYKQDPRTYAIIPFLCTTAVTTVVFAAALVAKSAWKTTLVLHTNVASWLIHFSYLLAYTDHSRLHDDIWKYWADCFTPIVTLHIIMLVLLAVASVLCGLFLRRSEVEWPRCNCIQIFTLNTPLIVARLVMGIIAFVEIVSVYGRGFRPYDQIDSIYCKSGNSCSNARLPASLIYGAGATLCFSVVFTAESILSSVWGTKHVSLSIVVAVLSGVSNLALGVALSPVFLPDYKFFFHPGYEFCFVTSVLHMFHAFTLAYCYNFIASPPNALKLICGGIQNRPETEDDETTIEVSNNVTEDVGTEIEHGGGGDSADAEEFPSPPLTGGVNAAVGRGRCLVTNILIWIIGLTSLGTMGAVPGSYGPSWENTMLLTTETAAVATATVAIISVISTGNPPAQPMVQMILQNSFECLLILIAIVANLGSNQHTLVIISCVLAIVLLLLKISDIAKTGPIQKILQFLAAEDTASMAMAPPPEDPGSRSTSSSPDASPSAPVLVSPTDK